MNTEHRIYFKSSMDMNEIESNTIDLIITSPPYPMIEMWDSLFIGENNKIKQKLEEGKGLKAFKLMHKVLNNIWVECSRVLTKAGVICINIGDATRKVREGFQLYPNHAKIISFFQDNEFIMLPSILWRKPTNSPTKFMGSGMLPSNAYVTLEHEYILLFRKGKKPKKFPPKSETRYQSAYFWEERNKWFSDVWSGIRGESQSLENFNNLRERSAAFPIDIPYRLINMFSIYGDTVLDPFWGCGTTSIAAMISARNSIGYEKEAEFTKLFQSNVKSIKVITDSIQKARITNHMKFIKNYEKNTPNTPIKYRSTNYHFPVLTKQEKEFLLYSITNVQKNDNSYKLEHEKYVYPAAETKKKTNMDKYL